VVQVFKVSQTLYIIAPVPKEAATTKAKATKKQKTTALQGGKLSIERRSRRGRTRTRRRRAPEKSGSRKPQRHMLRYRLVSTHFLKQP